MKIDLRCTFCSLIGRRGSGKSTTLKHLIKQQGGRFKEIFIICPSSFNGDFKDLVSEKNIFENYDENWVMALVKKMIDANKGKTKDSKDFKNVLLILDDVVSSDKSGHYSKSLKLLASRGRHTGIVVILTAQWLTSISPLQRLNSDYLFIGKTNASSIGILYDEFNLNEQTEKQFRAFVQKNTDDHRFLVINNTASNTSDTKQVYGSIKVNI